MLFGLLRVECGVVMNDYNGLELYWDVAGCCGAVLLDCCVW